jgi:hypothetical protein
MKSRPGGSSAPKPLTLLCVPFGIRRWVATNNIFLTFDINPDRKVVGSLSADFNSHINNHSAYLLMA